MGEGPSPPTISLGAPGFERTLILIHKQDNCFPALDLLCDLGQVSSPLWTWICSFANRRFSRVCLADGCCVPWLRGPDCTSGHGLLPSLPVSLPTPQAPGHQPGAEHWPRGRASAIRPLHWGPFLGLRRLLWARFPARCPCVVNRVTTGAAQ